MRYIEWLFLLVIGALRYRTCKLYRIRRGICGVPSRAGGAGNYFHACSCLYKGDPSEASHCCLLCHHWSSGCLSFISGKGFCDRCCGKDQFYSAVYHGGSLCRTCYRGSAENLCETGAEDPSGRSSGNDRNLPWILYLGFPDSEAYRRNLKGADVYDKM